LAVRAKIKGKLQAMESRALAVVLLTVFLDILGFGILLPVLPELIYNTFIPAGYSFNEALIALGWLTAVYPLVQFVATPVLGQLSDRHGRKPVLAISLIGTAIGYAVFALGILTHNISLLFIGRIIDGMTGGNISVARAVVADVSLRKHRARNFGLIGACFGVGFIMGPVIGARMAEPHALIFGLFRTPEWFNTATPFWFAALLSLLNMLMVVFLLPETNKHIDAALKVAWSQSVRNIKRAATHPALRIIFTAEFLFWGGFTFFTTFFQVLLVQKLGFKTSNVGDLFAYIGVCIALSQALLVPFVAKYIKSHDVLRFSLLGTGLALFLQLLPSTTWQLLLTAPVIAIFNGLTVANSTALVSLSAERKIQGEVLGIEASVQALAQAVPAIIAGYVATFGVSTPVIAGGFIIVVGGFVYMFFYKVPKKVEAQETFAAKMAAAESS